MANAGGGPAGEGEWLKVAQLRALLVQAQEQDPRAKVSPLAPRAHLIFLFVPLRSSSASVPALA